MTLWTAQDIAERLKLHPRYVRDRLAKRKDFPSPHQSIKDSCGFQRKLRDFLREEEPAPAS